MRATGWIGQKWEVQDAYRPSLWRKLSAPQLFVTSFALLILVGTLGLKTLPGLYTGEPLGWLDALFTATSAVCVTGLIVADTATYFTPAGQAWILLLIQLGGLGMITFATMIILALGGRLSLRHEALSSAATNITSHVDHRQLTRDLIKFTLVFEAVGALILYLLWIPRFGFGGAIWHAIFHAVSAFCNAGFSTFSNSLMDFQRSPLALSIVMALIVAGGLGFLTLEELYLRRGARGRGRPLRISLHSRLVLGATAALLGGGWILFTALEWRLTLAEMPIWARPLNGLFMSVTARTAGFNTIDYNAASGGTNFLTVLLMSIGGSPGSTAGGLKTTTFGLIGLLAWSRLRSRRIASLGDRSVPEETVQRAVGLFVFAFGVVTAAILGFVTLEMGTVTHSAAARGFLPYMFEAVSAFNTVGLSMGATGELSRPSLVLTILLMFIGRIGPLTFASAVVLRPTTGRGRYRFAYEDVVVG